jgi:hypothetical protein
MSLQQPEGTKGQATRQEEFNKALVEHAFRDVFASDAFDEGAIARYFSPLYAQKTDGRTVDFPGFVAHVRELKRTLKNVKITFERLLAEGTSVVSIHRAEAEKVAGGRIAVRVFARPGIIGFFIPIPTIWFCISFVTYPDRNGRRLGRIHEMATKADPM